MAYYLSDTTLSLSLSLYLSNFMKLYTDASAGELCGGIGWVIIFRDREKIEGNRTIEGNYTSMEMEYFALIEGLFYAKRYDRSEIDVYCDCKPLIEKMNSPDSGSELWRDRRVGCQRLLDKFDEWEIEWTPRGSNANADRLAFEALEEGRG